MGSYVVDGIILSKEATEPGHEWYFSYEELRPLIMPLLLGDADNDASDNESDDWNDEDGDSWVEEEEEGGITEDECENVSDSGGKDADKEHSEATGDTDSGTADPTKGRKEEIE